MKRALSKLAQKIGGTFSYPVITTTYHRKTFILTYTGSESWWGQTNKYPAELSVSTDIDLNSGFIIFKDGEKVPGEFSHYIISY
jgi:hypothetical protein